MSEEAAASPPAGEPYAVPERRKPSEGTHLVDSVRAAVDAWRAQKYPGACDTSKRLRAYWFDDEHRVLGASARARPARPGAAAR